MVSLETTSAYVEPTSPSDDGVVFVSATVTNTRATTQQITLESTLSGPIWAPACGGLAVPEWSGSRWCGVIDPGRSRGIGFASPSDTAFADESPLRLVDHERVETERATQQPATLLARLEDWSPTSDVLSSDR